MGGYAQFKESPKSMITSDQIGPGQILLSHLSPSLYTELRQINLHNHSGVKSQRIQLSALAGAFNKQGFLMYSSDGTKKYQITINSATGLLVVAEV